MAAPKAKTPQQSAALDRKVNDLSLRAYSVTEIAAQLGISKAAVSMRLKKLNQQARLDREAHIERELRTLDLVQREALDAWERSKQPAETLTVEEVSGAEKTTKRTEGQSGSPAHLANVLKASESRRKLLGLDAPTRQELSGADGKPIEIIEVVTTEAG